MNKTFVLLLGILFFVSCSSSSNKNALNILSVSGNFQGAWKGTGDMKSSALGNAACSNLSFRLDFPTNTLVISQFKQQCGTFSANLNDTTFQIVGTQLMHNGQAVGTISESVISGKYVDGSGGASGRVFDFKLELQPDGTIRMTEVASQANIVVLTIVGSLENSGI